MADHTLPRRIIREARPYWVRIAALLLLSLLATPLALLTPVPLKIAVDNAIGSEPLPGFVNRLLPGQLTESPLGILSLAAALVLIIALLNRLQMLATWFLMSRTGEEMVLGFQCRLFEHAQVLSLSYHDSVGTADSVFRIQRDAAAIRDVAVDGLIPFANSAFLLVSMAYVTARIDWQLALIAASVAPALVYLTATYRRRLRSQWRAVRALESAALGVIQEALSSLRVVRAFGQEKKEHQRFRDRHGEGLDARLKAITNEGMFSLLTGMTIAVGTAAFLFVGVRHVLAGVLTLGGLLLVMSYLQQLYEPLISIGKQVTDLQKALASTERAFAFLEEEPDVVESRGARSIIGARGSIVLENVCYEYEPKRPVLADLSFAVEPGRSVGITGKTGAGKSTLLSLLARFHDPTSGRVLLDGVDLRDYQLEDLRKQYAIVLQDTLLFSTTIRENIAYARPTANVEEIAEAARAANAHEFISELPAGYETLVGERGMRLSGGERQRIGLARAFLRNSPILLLDEPTSSVDLRTEALIMEAMERLMAGRTTFMVAHRVSTLENCDMLLVLDEGRIISNTSAVAAALAQVRRSGEPREVLGA